MPFTLPSRTPSAGPRRRSLFAGAAGAVLLVGCSPGAASDTGGGPSAADRARARVARDSETLAERYTAVLAAHPALAGLLEPLRAEVVRHAKAFGGKASATPSASDARSGSASPSPVPADEKAALAELVTAEKQLADRRTKALLAVPGELARLMASVAAAGAVHVFLLTEGAK
ncbi:hypothetical protein [Streptomyces sp. NPDC046862]|uniref:hypothetical protein n=1 Tax=Streptomyces sp. NPDC046862 TaxID=3154603 RepID=UPI0034566884